jgi:hypothetical protein
MRQGAPDFNSLIKALRAQEATLSELDALSERQTDTIGGVVVVLRALIDIVLDEEQRAALETHLNMTVAGDVRRSRQAIIDALLD